MRFSEKYTDDVNDKDKSKKILSNDAFALGETIQNLTDAIENLRLSLRR